jgi:hypothetical protein
MWRAVLARQGRLFTQCSHRQRKITVTVCDGLVLSYQQRRLRWRLWLLFGGVILAERWAIQVLEKINPALV